MKKHLTYDDMIKICNDINEKHIPTEDPFLDKVDQLFENGEMEGYDFIQHSFKELLKVVDSEINRIERGVNISPTCEKGCANCCYFPIILTKLEAKMMIAAIHRLPEEQKNNLKNHLIAYHAQYSKEIKELCSINFKETPDYKYNYISRQLPCPLLNVENNECMAYEIRPIPCRTYLNYCNPNVCKENFIPEEPFSYEFLHGYYMESLNEIVQTVLYEEDEDFGIQYPEDLFKLDYLPNLLTSFL